MSTRELFLRGHDYLRDMIGIAALPLLSERYKLSKYPASRFDFALGEQSKLAPLTWDLKRLADDSQKLIDNEIGALSFQWKIDTAQCWRRAPDTGRVWPEVYWRKLDYRPGNRFGDIRVLWEPARLQRMVGCALLANKYGEGRKGEKYAEIAIGQFTSWFAANRWQCGPHYVSVMECALRIISLSHSLDIIRPALKKRQLVWSMFAAVVDQHAGEIFRRLSLHSSAGNHTIAEAVGLIYAGLILPELKGSKEWFQKGLTVLNAEVPRQILSDGGALEMAIWYHIFVTDLVGLAMTLMRHHGSIPDRHVVERYKLARRFLRAFHSSNQPLARFGDSDDGYALSEYLADPAPWVMCEAHENRNLHFMEGGYSNLKTKDGWCFVFDHGPLGMAPGYGHGHADALSVVVGDEEEFFLVDPGTFMYGGSSVDRNYFRSTRAHNTLTVDGNDQAQQEATFLWSHPYRIIQKETGGAKGFQWIVASHDGYTRLGYLHMRGLLVSEGEFSLVLDRLVPMAAVVAKRRLGINWHLCPTQVWSITDLGDGSKTVLSNRLALTVRRRGPLCALDNMEIELRDALYSPSYGRKIDGQCFHARADIKGQGEVLSIIRPRMWRSTNENVEKRTEELSFVMDRILNRFGIESGYESAI